MYRLNLSGKRFGRLKVLNYIEKDKYNRSTWLCECDCGNRLAVATSALTSGNTKSCGCLHMDLASKLNKRNLKDKRFGRLQVINPTNDRNASGCMLWECLCDCGNTVFVSTNHLNRGMTKSCGCLQKEQVSHNLLGKTFGRLHVTKKTTVRLNNQIVWECECACGSVCYIRSSSLLEGDTKSCGCLHRERSTTHGLSHTKEYKTMLSRNRDEKKKAYDSNWTIELEKSLREFQPFCAICGILEAEHRKRYGRSLHIDHVLPLSKGNGLKSGNAVLLCSHHNCSKYNKNLKDLPLEWQASLIWNAFKFADYWMELNNEHIS